MRFEGTLIKPDGKKNRYWGIEIPILHIHTQGKTRKDALFMVKDAIESLLEKKLFRVRVHAGDGDTFTVDSDNSTAFIAFMLRRQRQFRGLSVRDVAERLKSKSPNAYAQYEQGRVKPSMDKLVELMRAIDPDFEPVLKAG
jgi:predicted RNase H-like HicB family nuclease